jgi:hypothetical protein
MLDDDTDIQPEDIWKEVLMTQLKLFRWHSPGNNEEPHDNLRKDRQCSE